MFNALNNKNDIEFSLIMPVLNEGHRIIPTICTLAYTTKYAFELIIVFDNENDITIDVINKLKKNFCNIRTVKNEGKRVIGAIKTGFSNCNTEIVGIWLPYHVDPFGLVNTMFEMIKNQNCDLVSGNRFNKIKRVSRGNIIKKLLSRTGNYFLNRIIGIPLGDITTSIKLYKSEFIKNTPIETDISGGWSISTELAVKAAIKGCKIGEIEFKPENTNIINGVSNFKVFKQLDFYLKWLKLGFKFRKQIKLNYKEENFIRK